MATPADPSVDAAVPNAKVITAISDAIIRDKHPAEADKAAEVCLASIDFEDPKKREGLLKALIDLVVNDKNDPHISGEVIINILRRMLAKNEKLVATLKKEFMLVVNDAYTSALGNKATQRRKFHAIIAIIAQAYKGGLMPKVALDQIVRENLGSVEDLRAIIYFLDVTMPNLDTLPDMADNCKQYIDSLKNMMVTEPNPDKDTTQNILDLLMRRSKGWKTPPIMHMDTILTDADLAQIYPPKKPDPPAPAPAPTAAKPAPTPAPTPAPAAAATAAAVSLPQVTPGSVARPFMSLNPAAAAFTFQPSAAPAAAPAPQDGYWEDFYDEEGMEGDYGDAFDPEQGLTEEDEIDRELAMELLKLEEEFASRFAQEEDEADAFEDGGEGPLPRGLSDMTGAYYPPPRQPSYPQQSQQYGVPRQSSQPYQQQQQAPPQQQQQQPFVPPQRSGSYGQPPQQQPYGVYGGGQHVPQQHHQQHAQFMGHGAGGYGMHQQHQQHQQPMHQQYAQVQPHQQHQAPQQYQPLAPQHSGGGFYEGSVWSMPQYQPQHQPQHQQQPQQYSRPAYTQGFGAPQPRAPAAAQAPQQPHTQRMPPPGLPQPRPSGPQYSADTFFD